MHLAVATAEYYVVAGIGEVGHMLRRSLTKVKLLRQLPQPDQAGVLRCQAVAKQRIKLNHKIRQLAT